MRRRPGIHGSRRAATVVEFALIGPLAMLFTIGLIVAVSGAFRLQQLGYLAHEGARWASLHGPEWESVTDNEPVTKDDVLREAVLPLVHGLDPNRLSCDVTWNEGRTFVQVTLTYQWLPEAFASGGPMTSTSVRPVSY